MASEARLAQLAPDRQRPAAAKKRAGPVRSDSGGVTAVLEPPAEQPRGGWIEAQRPPGERRDGVLTSAFWGWNFGGRLLHPLINWRLCVLACRYKEAGQT